MSGNTPAKDQLVHNNLAHKLLFWAQQNPGHFTLKEGHFRDGEDQPLVWIDRHGFNVSPKGAEFILANLARDVLSHREVKIMKDMTRPAPKAPTATEVAPELVNPDPSLSIAGLF